MTALTKQEWFNGAWEQAKKLKPSRESVNGNCYYRDPVTDGNKCFIGASLQDEDYDSNLEGKVVSTLLSSGRVGVLEDGDLVESEIFLCSLQRIHDMYLPERWEARLRSFADNYGLDIPSPFSTTETEAEVSQ